MTTGVWSLSRSTKSTTPVSSTASATTERAPVVVPLEAGVTPRDDPVPAVYVGKCPHPAVYNNKLSKHPQ